MGKTPSYLVRSSLRQEKNSGQRFLPVLSVKREQEIEVKHLHLAPQNDALATARVAATVCSSGTRVVPEFPTAPGLPQTSRLGSLWRAEFSLRAGHCNLVLEGVPEHIHFSECKALNFFFFFLDNPGRAYE